MRTPSSKIRIHLRSQFWDGVYVIFVKRSRRRYRSLQIVCNQFVFQVLTKYPVEDIWEDEYLKLEYGCLYEGLT